MLQLENRPPDKVKPPPGQTNGGFFERQGINKRATKYTPPISGKQAFYPNPPELTAYRESLKRRRLVLRFMEALPRIEVKPLVMWLHAVALIDDDETAWLFTSLNLSEA